MGLRGSFLPSGSCTVLTCVNTMLQRSVFVRCPCLLSSTSRASLCNLRDGPLDIGSRSLEIGRSIEKTWSLEPPSINLESRQDLGTDKGLSPLSAVGRNSKHIVEMYRRKAIFLEGYRHPRSRDGRRRLRSYCGSRFAISFLTGSEQSNINWKRITAQ